MNAADQADLALKLQRALTSEGLVIQRAVLNHGNISDWEAVPAASVLGRLLSLGWRVRVTT